MPDIIKMDFDNMPTSRTFVRYTGKLVSCIIRKIGKNAFTVTDILLDSTAGYRLFSVSLATGQALYEYINNSGRIGRMPEIDFTFNVLLERQIIMDYFAHDKREWIGDALDREKAFVMGELLNV